MAERCAPTGQRGPRLTPLVFSLPKESLGAGTQAKYALPHSAAWSERLGELFDSGSNGDVKISVVEDGRPMEPVWAHVFILHLNPKVRDSQTPLSIHTTSHCSRHARAFIR